MRNTTLNRTLLHYTAAVGLLTSLIGIAPAKVTVNLDPEVEKLIPEIRTNENLYRNFDISYAYTYRQLAQPNPRAFSKVDVTARQIVQGDNFYVNYDHKAEFPSGSSASETHVAGYDGTTTRVWYRNTIGQVHHGRSSERLVRPHSLIGFSPRYTLSEYLRKGLNDAGVPDSLNITQTFTRQPDDVFLQEKCIVLESHDQVSGAVDGKEVSEEHITDVWIAPGKNDLPIRMQSFSITGGSRRLQTASQLASVDEVQKDVFFPKTAAAVNYDTSSSKPIELSREEWTIKDIQLDADYPLERFTNIRFRKGATVFMIKDGVVQSQFEAGGDETTQPVRRKSDPSPTAPGRQPPKLFPLDKIAR